MAKHGGSKQDACSGIQHVAGELAAKVGCWVGCALLPLHKLASEQHIGGGAGPLTDCTGMLQSHSSILLPYLYSGWFVH